MEHEEGPQAEAEWVLMKTLKLWKAKNQWRHARSTFGCHIISHNCFLRMLPTDFVTCMPGDAGRKWSRNEWQWHAGHALLTLVFVKLSSLAFASHCHVAEFQTSQDTHPTETFYLDFLLKVFCLVSLSVVIQSKLFVLYLYLVLRFCCAF